MNLMLSAKRTLGLSNAWLVACYASLLPFGLLCFHDCWYGIGWGMLAGPLMLIGTLIGSVCSGVALWFGNWWQKLIAVPTSLLFGTILFQFASQLVGRLSDLF